MAPHSTTLAWKIPWMGEPGRLQSMGSLGVRHKQLHFHFSLSCIGEGNGNPLQCSCLQNPRDGGAWWAAVYGVAQSRTRRKPLSSSSRKHANMHMEDEEEVVPGKSLLSDSQAEVGKDQKEKLRKQSHLSLHQKEQQQQQNAKE